MSTVDKIIHIQSELQGFSTQVYLFQQHLAEKMKLHPTDFHSIHLLDRYGAMTAGQLAVQLKLTSGATTAAIDRLVELGYAERVASNVDRRSTIIQLCPDGINKIKAEYESIEKNIETMLQEFSDLELEIIGRFLRAMTSI